MYVAAGFAAGGLVCGCTLLSVTFIIANLLLLIFDIIVLLSHGADIVCSCSDPIYTWLAFSTMILLLFACSGGQGFVGLINFICSIIVYVYAIYYYGRRDLCMDDSTHSTYDLMLVYIILLSISYFVLIIVIIIEILACCLFGATLGLLFVKSVSDKKSYENLGDSNSSGYNTFGGFERFFNNV